MVEYRIAIFLIVLAIFVFAIIWLFAALFRSLASGSGSIKSVNAEEARAMQEIHQGLGKLEKRVEALETLLLERAKMEKWEQLERE